MSNPLNITTAAFGGLREVTTSPLWQWDYGQILAISGLDLPQAFEVHFSNSRKSGETITQIGTDSQVTIPDMYLTSGADIYAFVFLHDGTDDGETEYVIKIPVRERPEPSDIEPTPEQQDVITEAIAALNDAVEQTGEDKAATAALAEAAAASSLIATQAAQSAQGSATAASGSATTATDAAGTATTKASEAATSAANAASAKTAAETAETNAQAAKTASESAQASAESAAQTATAKASEAAASAASVGEAAQTATAKAAEASASATSASGSATAAAGSATTASTKASEASASATAAQTAKTQAESARDEAATAKTDAESAKNEAQSIVDGISAKASQIDNNTADIASLEEDRYKPYVADSASGSIASFPDGADDIPMKSLVVDINPVQDLHGYDHPWPAGGGKNKINNTASTTTTNGITFTVNSDGSVSCSGTATGVAVLRIWQTFDYSEDMILNGCPSGGNYSNTYSMILANQNGQIVNDCIDTGSGRQILASYIADVKQVQIIVRTGTDMTGKVFYPMLRLSTVTDSTYAPYSNICPISGWTGATASRTGVNLLDTTGAVNGGINADGSVNANPADSRKVTKMLSVKPNTAYYFWNVVPATSGRSGYWYDASGNGIHLINLSGSNASSGTATSPANAAYCRVNYLATNENICMMSLGTTQPASYEPYTGHTYPISWQTEAGTVYGGTLDVVSGVLTVDRAMVDLGELTFSATNTANIFYAGISDMRAGYSAKIVCEAYKRYSAYYTGMPDKSVANNSTYGYIYIKDTDYSDADTFMASLSGIYLAYEIKNPTTVQLTPHEVRTLLGLNNVWADTGDVEVQYRADTKLYIDGKGTDWAKLIAPTEAAYTATRAYTSGSLLIVGNQLYKATTSIANGATLTVGTNITATTLAEVIAAL